ncbi:hypothetical protein RDI58_029086 [Solanum bulbocastanum]|uniref:Uncharacterized protein n=1 Tax=Solanum bulbocastanum TaxID=147425 RepID=A0AAN8Y025_SOLBU
MDVTGKTKDNVKARLDLPEHCRRSELHIQESANNKLLKPKASYSFIHNGTEEKNLSVGAKLENARWIYLKFGKEG